MGSRGDRMNKSTAKPKKEAKATELKATELKEFGADLKPDDTEVVGSGDVVKPAKPESKAEPKEKAPAFVPEVIGELATMEFAHAPYLGSPWELMKREYPSKKSAKDYVRWVGDGDCVEFTPELMNWLPDILDILPWKFERVAGHDNVFRRIQ